MTTKYVYDGLDIVQEKQSGVVTANYIRTLNIDEPLARIKSDGTVRFYVQDALGSVIALTDENGVVMTSYAYDPFGNVTVSGEASDNPFQYTGRENDGTGPYYYRARYYSPELQRFISEDPIRFEGGDVNFFAYVFNSPLNLTDPEGKGFIACGKALYDCGGACKQKSDECRGKHGDPQACFDRGESEVGDEHLIKECYAKIPECTKCVEDLLKCGFSPIRFPKITK